MSFKTLLWKEYRQSRQLLMTSAALLVFPYLAVVLIWLIGVLWYGGGPEDVWAHQIAVASLISLFISAGLCAFVTAHVMAGERADRSAEFAGYLPISRESAALAKAVFTVGVGLVMLLSNGLVGALCNAVEGTRGDSYSSEVPSMLAPAVIVAVLVFGVSWLASTFVDRPATGAAWGLASVFVLGMLVMFLEEAFGYVRPSDAATMEQVSAGLFLAVGAACFVVGVMFYLRRVEP